MQKTICLIGAFDTKGEEYAFVREQILSRGHKVFTVNTGVLGTTALFPVDVEADRAMFDAIKANVRAGIPVIEMDNNINDPEFSAKAVEMMLELIKQAKQKKRR